MILLKDGAETKESERAEFYNSVTIIGVLHFGSVGHLYVALRAE